MKFFTKFRKHIAIGIAAIMVFSTLLGIVVAYL
ncbi:hypothetical protein EDC18_11316 [Natranaerovirga pectinivora]|uniref:Uncharacterized protein n=1 Tax=Natranaerovirga pectinivora TaxID=682400 RepID=A0A4R3MF75_9FIRM|nr:hypothetical protein EDC18_11316 [Natranaerovirga pectinivora]